MYFLMNFFDRRYYNFKMTVTNVYGRLANSSKNSKNTTLI